MISVLAHVAAASVAGGNVTSAAIDTSNAFLLVAYVAWDQNSVNAQFQDSKGNIWQHVAPQSEFQIGTLFYCIGPTVGAGHTFTASATNSSFPSLCVAAFGEVSVGVASLDQNNGAASASGSTATFQPGSITPSINGELIVAGIGFGNATSLSVDSGFTITDQNAFLHATHYGTGLAWFVQPAAAAIDPTWTAIGPTMGAPVGSIASFEVPVIPINLRVFQSAMEFVSLSNPHARVFQSALELIVIPGPVSVIGVQIILRGVKRYSADGTASEPLQEIQEPSHVKKAV